MKIRLTTFFILILSPICLVAEELDPDFVDRVEIEGGAILTGKILESTSEVLLLETPYAGTLEVDFLQVERLVSVRDLSGVVPRTFQSKVAQSSQPAPTPTVAASPDIGKKPTKTAAPRPTGWELEVGANLKGSAGNSDKFDLGLAGDAKLKQKFYRLDLYGRYSYSKNRGKETSNELILGTRYTNFFYDRFGFFLREELEHDDFEGVDFRTTTAAGFSWRLHDEEDLEIEARSGLSYRYETYADHQQGSFPGMDFGLDLNWRLAQWMQFKGSYGFIPSFGDSDDYIVTQDSGFNIPLDKSSKWKVRLGLVSKYNNQPERNREQLDHQYYARLIAGWK